MRAPRECGSWFWDLDGVVEPGLKSALRTARRMGAILQKHALLEPDALEWNWFQVGKGGLGIHSRLDLARRSLDDPALPDALRACRPTGHSQAEMGEVLVLGSGTWFDASGTRHNEYRLVELMVSPDEIGPSAELSVYHDVWGLCDFRANPTRPSMPPTRRDSRQPCRNSFKCSESRRILAIRRTTDGQRAMGSRLLPSSTDGDRTSPMRYTANLGRAPAIFGGDSDERSCP
ncbi:hypothetical protein NKH18_17875 [Streptomyces sp. M10(2022)]